jgi:D-aminoacyl-tRNA deacylase
MAFIEIGSTEKEWKDKKAGEFIAVCIMNVLNEGLVEAKAAIGCGGPHYAPGFSRKILTEDYATSHICPGYHRNTITQDMITQMIEKTKEDVELAILDWKGMKGEQRQGVSSLLRDMGIEHIRI